MLVVPIPLHRSKISQRGFNQARALAFEALSCLKKSHPSWKFTLASSTLMRLRATESQAVLTPRMRRLNVRGAFSVSDASAVKEKHILLVDDILTTGATARAAATALRKAGAASVWVATLARARRVSNFGQRSSFQDSDDIPGMPGNAPAEVLVGASGFSSHDQPSF
jgi:ComF family protein